MNAELLKETIKQELPGLLRDDPGLRVYLLDLMRNEYAGRAETQDRFYDLLSELRRDREERAREWAEYRDEQNRSGKPTNWNCGGFTKRSWRWRGTTSAALGHWDRAGVCNRRKRSAMRWPEFWNKALGCMQVVNVNDYDDEGTVFGRPDQVELDVIIKNGLLLICELKSSIDKAGMYIFECKARLYEKRHGRQANRLLVISPMIDARARQVAERLGIETYGDSTEVEAL